MTPEKVREVMAVYREMFSELEDVPPVKWTHDSPPDERKALSHCYAMLDQVDEFTRQGRMDKAFRWLGFIQGCLWACGIYTIDELKNHSRP